MPTPSHGRRVAMERGAHQNCSTLRQTQKVYPLGIHRSSSSLTLSTLSLSQNSNDSSYSSSISSWDQKIPSSFQQIYRSWERRGNSTCPKGRSDGVGFESLEGGEGDDSQRGELRCEQAKSSKRCGWITKNSDEVYISFHDECWGVPTYNDSRLFELLALCGMLIDYNWTEILKRRELYRDAFAKFDYNIVAKMEENDIMLIISNKELLLAEGRVRCIIDNAKCIQKVGKEFGSFSGYIWGHMNYKAMVNRHRYQRSVPLRTPKAEFISKDLVRRGFRLVGPVIVYSFMQAAGMAIDHVLDCFRFRECVRMAERSYPS